MGVPERAAPLQRFRRVDTRSPDEACEQVGRIFCPHLLRPQAARPAHFHARHHSAGFGDVSVNFVAYGATVDIDPGQLSNFYLVQMPLRGVAEVRCGTGAVTAEPRRFASVLSPTLPTRMIWHDGCEKVIVLIRRAALTRLWGRLNDAPARDVEFATGIDLTAPAGALLGHHLALMLEAAEQQTPVAAYVDHLGEGLMNLLLARQQHSGAVALARQRPAGDAAIARAEAFIAANADRTIAMGDVAEAAGTGLRALQQAFRRSRGQTLSAHIQNERLARFRTTLLAAEQGDSVTSLAYAAGFGHLGRAAALYRSRYGEAPSETLKRRS